MASVTFESVSKRFGDVEVVRDLSLDVVDKEFLVLLGPSGCGKSTALRMIAGLDDPTTGRVKIGDEVVNGIDARHRDVAMVFQSYALYPHMTVSKNIEAPLQGRGTTDASGQHQKIPKPERLEMVREAAGLLGLEDLLDRKPGELSGGQRQRVALARAIVRRPRVFLMDEPLSNLDAKLRTQTRLELVDLWRRLGITIIYVTHDQVEAMTMATRVAIIANGELQQVGTPHEVYHSPANLFVATFIGSPPINVLPSTLRGDQLWISGRAVATLPTGLRIAGAESASGSDEELKVSCAIRPEHVWLDESTTRTPETIAVRSRVRAVEDLGPETHVLCDLDGSLLTVRQGDEHRVPQLGDEVDILFNPTHLLFFDEAGNRLSQ